ncbi:MAG TPA: PhzF family phenazine biosynthesis protein [Myxococcota bacterium]|nr:PhzF family phenazine biosynthesis protein [Myxococcota bacterium]
MSSEKGLAYSVLDVFAEAPLEGNPVAVVFGAARLSGAEMQAIARETNLSETTFVLHARVHDGAFDVRIFTPASELPYAGHPTLGTATAIRSALLDDVASEVVLRLGVGPVRVRFAADGLAWLESPSARFDPFAKRDLAAAALGLPLDSLDPALPVEVQRTGANQLFVPLRDLAALRAARIEAGAYERLIAAGGPPSLYAFARGARDPRNHWSVRLFAPALGVPEDPATGSAAGFFGAYLARHRAHGDGTLDVRLEQGHEIGRPSLLHVRANGTTILVGGRVISVARGEWLW